MDGLNITPKSKIKVVWNTTQYDYNKDNEREIISAFAKRYGIPRDNITILPNFIGHSGESGDSTIADGIVTNINDPEFQRILFRQFVAENSMDCDLEAIYKIDSAINSQMDYDKYGKKESYSYEWIRWSNFLSYGDDNFIDFNELKGMVLLTSDPANQGGKTNFAVDLPHFIQYGVTGKTDLQEEIFNRYRPEATEVKVECCIKKDGVKYIIKRVLTRPALAKRTANSKVVSKVSYYRVEGDKYVELSDYDETMKENEGGATSRDTNKALKEAFGSPEDFDMTICATEDNLKDLFKKKDTDRGRILSRWIGLTPLEDKDVLARDTFNKSVKPKLYNRLYDKASVEGSVEEYTIKIKEAEGEIEKLKESEKDLLSQIDVLNAKKEGLIAQKKTIDQNVMKIDITTVRRTISDSTEEGLRLKAKCENIQSDIDSIGETNFSMDKYTELNNKKTGLFANCTALESQIRSERKTVEALQKAEYCPTCGRKFDNVDNTEKISQLESSIDASSNSLEEMKKELEKVKTECGLMEEEQKLQERKNRLVVSKASMEVQMASLREAIVNGRNQVSEYEKNAEAIDFNNRIDISLNTLVQTINGKNTELNNVRRDMYTKRENVASMDSMKKELSARLDRINQDIVIDKNWGDYLEMVGKNGVGKMVLKSIIPSINANLVRMLDGVCDFTVEMSMNMKNEVSFYIIKNGVRGKIKSESGFEKFASAMALRCVLGSMSTLPKLNFIVLDELLGSVAKINYESVKMLLDRVLEKYDTIIQVTHNEDIKDWFTKKIMVRKVGEISTIEVS